MEKPAVLYGAEIWGVRARDSRVSRLLVAVDRMFGLAVVPAYRTVSTDVLCVLAGLVPLSILATELHEE